MRSLTDGLKYFKKEAKEVFENIILDDVDPDGLYERFKDYKEDMEDFTFDSIFNK